MQISNTVRIYVRFGRTTHQSANLAGAEQKLADFSDKWGQKYPLVVESWKRNWLRLTRFF